MAYAFNALIFLTEVNYGGVASDFRGRFQLERSVVLTLTRGRKAWLVIGVMPVILVATEMEGRAFQWCCKQPEAEMYD